MEQNLPVWQCSDGQPTASGGTTFSRASRSRTHSSKASTASCATNASTSTCSRAWLKRVRSSKRGGTTITTSGHIQVSERLHLESSQTSKGTVRLSKFGAPRTVPLLHRLTWGKTSTDSTYECGQVGMQTT